MSKLKTMDLVYFIFLFIFLFIYFPYILLTKGKEDKNMVGERWHSRRAPHPYVLYVIRRECGQTLARVRVSQT